MALRNGRLTATRTLNLLYNKKIKKVMTKNEFLEKWSLPEVMIETNTDFKQMLLTNISHFKYCKDSEEIEKRANALKEFVSDFYSAQPNNVATFWF